MVGLLYILLSRIFRQKAWLPWIMTAVSLIYLSADTVIFSTHLGQHARILLYRIPAAVIVLALFIIAMDQKPGRASWTSVIAGIGMISAFWGNPLWAFLMALLLAGLIWHRRHKLNRSEEQPDPKAL